MNDISQGMLTPARFMADEKAARAREDQLEVMAEREAAEYFDDCETGDNTEWALYDIDESAESLISVWAILEGREESAEKVALIRAIIRKLMRAAAESHAAQVMSRR